MHAFWNTTYFGNTIINWLITAGIILGGIAFLRLIKSFVLSFLKKWSQKTTNSFDDLLVSMVEKSLIPFLYIMAIYMGIHWLELSARASSFLRTILLLLSTFFILKSLTAALQYFILSFLKSRGDGDNKQKEVRGILIIGKAIIWILGIVFLLDNMGYNISTIIAGLGIGGIAIALAAQTILGDLFSYFVILFDKPFEIGDFIIVDDKMGVVENIGIKTTRLRNLAGEQLICSNKDLTDSRIHNYKRMEKRRVILKLGVTYQTAPEILESIPAIIKKIITGREEVVFDRAHFSGFGDFSLNFETVYYILSSDYNLFMDKQQAINFKIYSIFEHEKISFAFPTQTLFINHEKEPVGYPR